MMCWTGWRERSARGESTGSTLCSVRAAVCLQAVAVVFVFVTVYDHSRDCLRPQSANQARGHIPDTRPTKTRMCTLYNSSIVVGQFVAPAEGSVRPRSQREKQDTDMPVPGRNEGMRWSENYRNKPDADANANDSAYLLGPIREDMSTW